jgi:hypothetical protein
MSDERDYELAAEWICRAVELETKASDLRLRNDVIRADLAQIEADVFRVCARQLLDYMVNGE